MNTSSKDHWNAFSAQWSRLGPPLRPPAVVIDQIVDIVADHARSVLLLGVTPELSTRFDHLLAVDKNQGMIDMLWSGNTDQKRVVCHDWLQPEVSWGAFSAVIGDASMNAITYPDEVSRLLEIVADRLDPGGIFACRVFTRPQQAIERDTLLRITRQPATIGFHAFKWMIAMHIAALRTPTVAVADILATFNQIVEDRAQLAANTGWNPDLIATIDVYKNSPARYCFPTREEIVASLPEQLNFEQFKECGTYDLAALCPILVCRKSA